VSVFVFFWLFSKHLEIYIFMDMEMSKDVHERPVPMGNSVIS